VAAFDDVEPLGAGLGVDGREAVFKEGLDRAALAVAVFWDEADEAAWLWVRRMPFEEMKVFWGGNERTANISYACDGGFVLVSEA
jgi:hypothetical protein